MFLVQSIQQRRIIGLWNRKRRVKISLFEGGQNPRVRGHALWDQFNLDGIDAPIFRRLTTQVTPNLPQDEPWRNKLLIARSAEGKHRFGPEGENLHTIGLELEIQSRTHQLNQLDQ